MAKNYFVMVSTDPDVDPRKCFVGVACAAQAVKDGHQVHVFFASHAVRLLQTEYIGNIDERVGEAAGAGRASLDTLIQGAASMHCSGGSQAVVWVTKENADEVLIGGYELHWGGPPVVVQLSSAADVVLTF